MDAYDFTLNPYAGCSFGCSYCYAAFFSNGADKTKSWGAWVDVKENAVQRLKRRAAGLDGKLIYMSSVTDAYQPIERRLRITRSLLEVMANGHKPKLVVQTRSPDVVRDCDLFRKIIDHGGRVRVNFTVTTDDEELRRTFEPHCPSNRVRLRAAREMCESGVDTCITMTPLLRVKNVDAFAHTLLDTGVKNYIVQPFHFRRGKFIAGTRDKAQSLMADKLGTDLAHFRSRYLDHYRYVREVLKDRLPNLEEGKEGFRPPF
ncbi:MAG: radical SAM protein [Proteobacteria bacterium]|nr:radical SAM protein [Pseudomonadota bacterium]MYJ95113.1 radical SAM protein [Pseudomonadota bacterium]